jgi:hypothetical protein
MMKALYLLCLALGSSAFSQTITFKGCINLFDDQSFTFTKTAVDTYGKNIYITTPVDGQPCSGLGSCEFKIQWNNTLNRWEFLADDGDGDFLTPNLMYYNSTGNSPAANPPSNGFGTWVENTAITSGQCGGNLTATNSTMTGDVHSSTLATLNITKPKIQIFPNPVSDIISISGLDNMTSIEIFNMNGQLIKTDQLGNTINVSVLTPGVYLLRVTAKDSQIHEFKFVKK